MVLHFMTAVAAMILVAVAAAPARAQVLGTFSWQLSPYCNVITVTVTQSGSNYTLDGYDNQCGGSTRAAVTGIAVPNPVGTVTLGFTIVTAPNAIPVHVQTAIDLGSLGGSWTDDQGNTGTFVFSPLGIGSGSPRPAALIGLPDNAVTSSKILDGAVGALDIDPAQVQQRIQSACPSGQLMTGVNQNGTVVCQSVTGSAGGDITAVNAGTGLAGGGATGDVTLSLASNGVTTTHLANNAVNSAKVVDGSLGAVDIDPTQVQTRVMGMCPAGQAMRTITQTGMVTCEPITGSAGGDITAVIAGPGLSGGATTGDATLSVAYGGTGAVNLAARSDHTHALAGTLNTAVGASALSANISGAYNLAAGGEALMNSTGGGNTAVGARAGQNTTSGALNTFIGYGAGRTNTTGQVNTIVGQWSDLAAADLVNATAIGNRALVGANNALVLGSIDGVNGADADTNVGIGTTSPTVPLDIATEVPTSPTMRVTNYGGPAELNLRSARGTRIAPAAVLDGDLLGDVRAGGYNGITFGSAGQARIEFSAAENWAIGSTGTYLTFHTTANGTASSLERVRIGNGGRVGIGTPTPQQLLDVAGDIRVGATGTNDGCVEDRNGSVIAGTCSSDVRFKRDVTPFPNMLERVVRLRPVSYFWRADEFPERHFGTSATVGLIAQDVEAVFPDLVTTAADGFKAVNYSKLPLLTLQAVRELAGENATLRAQVATLSAELESVRQVARDVAALRTELAALSAARR